MRTQLSIDIDPESKKQLKIYAVLKNKTIKAIVFEALSEYLEKGKTSA